MYVPDEVNLRFRFEFVMPPVTEIVPGETVQPSKRTPEGGVEKENCTFVFRDTDEGPVMDGLNTFNVF